MLHADVRCAAESIQGYVEGILIHVVVRDAECGGTRARCGGGELHREGGAAAWAGHWSDWCCRDHEIVGLRSIFGDAEACEIDVADVFDREGQTGAAADQHGAEVLASSVADVRQQGLFNDDVGREPGSAQVNVEWILVAVVDGDSQDGAAAGLALRSERDVEGRTRSRIQGCGVESAEEKVGVLRTYTGQS